MSKTQIPEYAKNILNLGDKFNFMINLEQRTIFEFIKELEYGLKGHKDNDEIREKILDNLNQQIKKNKSQHIPFYEKTILDNIKATKNFLKNNPNLFVTKADKGNVTVIMEKTEYIKKVEEALADNNYYSSIKKSSLSKLQNNIKKLIKDWEDKGVLETDDSFNYLKYNNIDNTNLARAYALVKIHKKNYPIRIIVSAIGSPTYALDKSLSKLFNRYFPRPSSSVKNSLEVKNIIDSVPINDELELSSFDVVSLFTNIPHNYIIDGISKKWRYLNNKINFITGRSFAGLPKDAGDKFL